MDVIQWLLERENPGVAYLARRRLLDEDPDGRSMKSLRNRCNDYPPVATMLKRAGEAIVAGNYQKYKGAYWTLIILADLQADGRDKQVQRLTQHCLETQLATGGFAPSSRSGHEIVCLTANVLRAAVHFGCGGDERVVRGYRRLMERIGKHRGVPCFILDHTLQTSCKMTLPQTLRSLAAAPDGVAGNDLDKARDSLVKQLLAIRVYRYVRPDAKEFYEAVELRADGVKVREVKTQWLAEHKVTKSELKPKPGWLRFGFPNSYNPDLLEAMLALAELGVERSRVLDESLDHIEKKRTPEGVWLLDDSLNGKMLADVECRGEPSRWITLRAMQVLKHFGRL
jgi:hypothetical protein